MTRKTLITKLSAHEKGLAEIRAAEREARRRMFARSGMSGSRRRRACRLLADRAVSVFCSFR